VITIFRAFCCCPVTLNSACCWGTGLPSPLVLKFQVLTAHLGCLSFYWHTKSCRANMNFMTDQ
jgi:hypothetical protein